MSTADELIKLDALRQSGVLTQEEFDTAKGRLLGGSVPSAKDEKEGTEEEEDFQTEEESEDEIVSPNRSGFGGAFRASWDEEELWDKAGSEPPSSPLADPLTSVPDLFPLPSPHFLVFAQDGKLSFGWEQSGFYIKARERTRHSFPLTPAGWTAAWELMSSHYPQLAAKVATAVERTVQADRSSSAPPRSMLNEELLPQGSPGLSPSMPSKSVMQAEGWVYRPSPSGVDGLEIEDAEYGNLFIDRDGVGIGARKPRNIKLRWSEVSDVTCEEDPIAEFTCQDGRSVVYRFWDISAETLRSIVLEASPNETQDTTAKSETLRGQGSIYRPSSSDIDGLELDDAEYGNVFMDRDGIGIGKTKPARLRLGWSEVIDVTCYEEPVVEFTRQDGRLVGYRVRDVSVETLRSAILAGWPEGRAFLTPPPSLAKPNAGQGVDGDIIDQIRRLGELRDSGLITPGEFEIKKAELLGRL